LRPPLLICAFLEADTLVQRLKQCLEGDRPDAPEERYVLIQPASELEFFTFVEQQKQQIDCLILQHYPPLLQIILHLKEQTILLPTVVVDVVEADTPLLDAPAGEKLYHEAVAYLAPTAFQQIPETITEAIDKFLQLSPACVLPEPSSSVDRVTELTMQNTLLLQQRRLADKLNERLGYVGVFYKRNPKNFLRRLSAPEKQESLAALKLSYREIVLNYFSGTELLNQQIDAFVDAVFFADVPTAQVVEIHMELMDEFSTQLKLEGRSEEIVQDYRLTLIDTIAHLCEMYRRSLVKET